MIAIKITEEPYLLACANCGNFEIKTEQISCVPHTFDTGCSECCDGATDSPYYNHVIGKTAAESIRLWNEEQERLAQENRVEAADLERDLRQGR